MKKKKIKNTAKNKGKMEEHQDIVKDFESSKNGRDRAGIIEDVAFNPELKGLARELISMWEQERYEYLDGFGVGEPDVEEDEEGTQFFSIDDSSDDSFLDEDESGPIEDYGDAVSELLREYIPDYLNIDKYLESRDYN